MRLKGRLGKLETETVGRWHTAWESYTERLFYYLDPVLDPLQAAATEAEAQGLFGDEAALNAACEAFCKRIGIPSPFALSEWEAKAELPDPDAPPDLSRWPSDLPEPPPEPSGVREKLEPYRKSPSLHERLPALLYLFWLAGVSPLSRGPSGTYQNHQRLKKRRSVVHICHKAFSPRGFLSTTPCLAIGLSTSKRVLRLDDACLFPSFTFSTATPRNALLTGTFAVLASDVPSWVTPNLGATLLLTEPRQRPQLVIQMEPTERCNFFVRVRFSYYSA